MNKLSLDAFVFENGMIGSSQIAARLNRRNDQIKRLIDKHRARLEKGFKPIRNEISKTGGRPLDEYYLSEDQFYFLVLLMDNTPLIVSLKQQIVSLYSKAGKKLFGL